MIVASPVQRRVLIMRHAKSSWADPGMADFDRPLNERGRGAAIRMGTKLREEVMEVDLILGSTACRVQQTLDLLLPHWGSEAPKMLFKELYLASRETLLRQLRALDGEIHRIMLVAHNPGVSELLGWFTHREEHFPTGAIAVLETFDQSPSWQTALGECDWQLSSFWKPKELD